MRFIVFDLEATCWRGRPPGGVNEVIEIGAVKMDRFGDVLGSFNQFVKPMVNPLLSHFCQKLTSIEQADVDQAKKFPQVIQQFKDWIDIYDHEYLLCAWGNADKRLLSNDCHLHKLETEWLEPFINLKDQYNEIKKNPQKTGLRASVRREGYEFTGVQHRAIADAENTAKIFRKYIDEWRF